MMVKGGRHTEAEGPWGRAGERWTGRERFLAVTHFIPHTASPSLGSPINEIVGTRSELYFAVNGTVGNK